MGERPVTRKKQRRVRPAQLPRRIERVVDDVLQRRLAGEDVSDDTVIRHHLDLMPELGERLEALKLVERDARLVQAARPRRKKPTKRYVEGTCPYCNSQYRIRAELTDHKIRCRHCKGIFLSDQFAASVQPPDWPDEDDAPSNAPKP